MIAKPPTRWFQFNLLTLFVLVAVAAVCSGVAVVVRETVALFTERDLVSFFPAFRGPKPYLIDTIVLVAGVVIVFGSWTYYRSTR